MFIRSICNSSTHEIAALGMRRSLGSSDVWEYLVLIFVQNLVAHGLAEQLIMMGGGGDRRPLRMD